MHTFSRFLTRNLLFALLFIAVFIVISLQSLSEIIHENHQAHGLVIQKYSSQESDIKQMARQLKASFDYQLLDIANQDGELLYHYQNNDSGFNLLSLFNINQQTSEVALKNKPLIVKYNLSFKSKITVYNQIVGLFIFCFLMMAVISSILTTRQLNKILENASQSISTRFAHDLKLILKNPEQGFTKEVSEQFKELADVLNEIAVQLTDKKSKKQDLLNAAYTDQLTGLQNRACFVEYFESEVVNKSSHDLGVLAIIRCSELQTINHINGYHEGDNYLCEVAKIATKQLSNYKDSSLYRLSSSDFLCLLPNINLTQAKAFAEKLTAKFNEYQQNSDLESVAFTGLVGYESTSPLGDLLASADIAISVAQTQHQNAWYIQSDTNVLNENGANLGNQNWRQEIESTIEAKSIELLLQPIAANDSTSLIYSEVLSRFYNHSGHMLPTTSFIAMAERLDKIIAIDRLIVDSVFALVKKADAEKQCYGVNISPRSVHDEHFLIWLERKLLKEPEVAKHLVFELSEKGLQQNIKTSKRFSDMLHRAGAKVTVERFGIGLTSFKFFRDLQPDYIKMDGSFTRNINEDNNNQYFIRLMIDLAHRVGVAVLAESVETKEERLMLESLKINGCQGYFIGRPEKR